MVSGTGDVAPFFLSIEGEEQVRITGPLVRVRVRVGRHVDYVELEARDGTTIGYGNPKGGDPAEIFELDLRSWEQIVRVRGRQNKHLDAIQFVTNLGRMSQWYGGSGGEPFEYQIPSGEMVVGLNAEDTDFCPRIFGLQGAPKLQMPPYMKKSQIVFNKNVRHLLFGGKPSLFRRSFRGKPSITRLLLANRAIMFRLLFRGNPSFVQLMLNGEQDKSNPTSLFRRLTEKRSTESMSALQLLTCADPKDPKSKSIIQMMLMGSPSVMRQFFGKRGSKRQSLIQLVFDRDLDHGYPSLIHLLTLHDTLDGVEHPSVMEAGLQGEQWLAFGGGPSKRLSLGLVADVDECDEEEDEEEDDEEYEAKDEVQVKASGVDEAKDTKGTAHTEEKRFLSSIERKRTNKSEKREETRTISKVTTNNEKRKPPLSLIRLCLMGKPSILNLLLEGENEGKDSIFRRIVEDKTKTGRSIARMALSQYKNHRGHCPALATYIFGGERFGRPSLLRLLLEGELREGQSSVLRLMLHRFDTKGRPTQLFRPSSSFNIKRRTSDARKLSITSPKSQGRKRSILDLLTAGSPSIADLFFKGELENEDSLARLMFGTCVDFSQGYLRLSETLQADSENGISLMQWLLVGEEDGGPGLSFLRLLMFGEEEEGLSLMRLLLMQEKVNEPSLLRILMAALKAILIAAKTRPSQLRNGEWRTLLDKLGKTFSTSRQEGSSTVQEHLSRLAESLNPNGEQMKLLLSVLKTIPNRGKEFQHQWKVQWLRVANEIQAGSRRAKSGSPWRKLGPAWFTIAEDLAHQRWSQLAESWAKLAAEAGVLDKLVVEKWTKRLKKVQSRVPWMF
eukprot:CAMPEP_0184560286 /NCGR_PEP_ID=MMETSP0199_2-20130426/46857_1 /TAXON_ID=1112570 /ORGANISM="Thraustochytrium sp., Strain LLF1b" /LENGTH=841 /DNA_ID=CAMNT_0026957587 /DNA_START=276 /DNA_END=2801 /DNA_ORIENTATION=-